MDNMMGFSACGGDGIVQASYWPRRPVIPILCAFSLITGLLVRPAETGAADPVTLIPKSLGIPSECFFTSARALNSGAYPQDLVVAGSVYCGGDWDYPYMWKQGAWHPLEIPGENYQGGYAESVSEDGPSGLTLTGHMLQTDADWDAWVWTEGQAPVELALLEGMTHIDNAIVSEQGDHIAGGNSNQAEDLARAVRWTREGEGWSDPQDIGPGRAEALTGDGGIVVGNAGDPWDWQDGEPWVWADGPNGGTLTMLEPEARVYDITHSGSMIVGTRPKACTNGNCDFFPTPVYWVMQGGQWTMHDLQALDGVTSEAKAVAEVNGQPVIAGYGYTNQDGGILRAVAWLPGAGGDYGAPLRLETIGGNFGSIAWVEDVNRQGIVLGWSETAPFSSTNDVFWNLFGNFQFQINAGLNDAWVNADAPYQGMFLTVFEDLNQMFLAWFTFDSVAPGAQAMATLGSPDHRWVTALGEYAGDRAELRAELTAGGMFNAPMPVASQDTDYGTINIEFTDCANAVVEYDFPGAGESGSFAITRLVDSNVAQCLSLAAR